MAYLDQLTEFLNENKIPFKQLDRLRNNRKKVIITSH